MTSFISQHFLCHFSNIENKFANIYSVLWFFIMLILGCGVFHLCFNQWARYKANPTVISLERDYRQWNGTMPAITLCYNTKFNRSKVDEYLYRLF